MDRGGEHPIADHGCPHLTRLVLDKSLEQMRGGLHARKVGQLGRFEPAGVGRVQATRLDQRRGGEVLARQRSVD